jgi:hypothetical protein
MSITGSFTDFSLAEILQFIDKGQKTGLLTVHAENVSQSASPVYYIWVYQGHIVAVANRLDKQGLVKLIEQSQVVSNRVLDKLVHWCCPGDKPLGKYLKSQGVLRASQLKQLFNIQVLQQVRALLQFKEGSFKFDPNAPLPTQEMTGLSLSAGLLSLSPPLKEPNPLHLGKEKFRHTPTITARRVSYSGQNSTPYRRNSTLKNKSYRVVA